MSAMSALHTCTPLMLVQELTCSKILLDSSYKAHIYHFHPVKDYSSRTIQHSDSSRRMIQESAHSHKGPSLTRSPVSKHWTRGGSVVNLQNLLIASSPATGTLWTAPEVLMGGLPSRAADVFAFGTTLYQILFRTDPSVVFSSSNADGAGMKICADGKVSRLVLYQYT